MPARTINIHEAKTHLSRLVDEVSEGGEIVIAKAGRPIARLVPLSEPAQKRRLGAMKGRFVVPTDFDAPLPDDVIEAFAGGRQ